MDIATLGLAVDSRPVKEAAKALDTLAAAGSRAEVATHKVEGASRASTQAAKDAAGAHDGLTKAYERNTVAIAAAVTSAALLVKGYVQVADSVTVLNNQLKLVTGSIQAAAVASEGLYQIAQRSRVNFIELGGTYASIARNAGEMGIAQSRVLKVTESIANAMTISGGSAASMNAALVQLGQGMSSGVLRGEELNSVMEQAPRLAKALADGLGVPIGRLREMGAAGEITAQQVVKALESQSAVLAKEVAGATMTVGQSFTQLSNASTKAIGEFDAASGSSAALAAAISAGAGAVDMLGTAFKNNAGVIQTVMGAIAGGAVLAALGAIPGAITAIGGALAGLGAVLAANPVVLALLGIGAVVGGGVAAVNALSKTDSGIKDAIRSLQAENERSEAALERAMAGGRTSGADNIRKTIEDRKKAVRELNAELALRETVSSPAEDARFAAKTAAVKAEEAAARELTGIRQKLYKVDADYLPTLQKLHQQYSDGRMTLQEYRADVELLAKANYKAPAAGPKGAASRPDTFLTESAKAYTSAMDALEKVQLAAGASADKLSKTQEVLRGIQASPAWETFNSRKREEIILAASLSQAEEDRQESIKATTAARDADLKKSAASTASDNAKAQALEDEIALWGKSEEAIKKLTIARLQDEKAVQMSYGDDKAVQAIEDRIEAITRLAVATDKVNNLKAADKAAKDAAAEWERTSNKIESDITAALMRGFESGKGFAENLRDVTVNMFKSMILEPTIRAIVSPAVGTVQSVLGLGGTAGRAASGALGMLGGGFNAGLGSVFGEAGTLGGLSAGTTALGAGNIMGGLGTLAGVAAPWIGGLSLLKSLTDYKVESRGSGLTASLAASGLPSGSVGRYNEFQQTGGLFGGGTTINRDWSTAGQDVADYMAGTVKAATTSAKAFATALGLAPEAVDGFTKDIEISITGLNSEQQTAAINAAIASFTSDMVESAYGGALEGLSRAGETSGQTLQRLASDLTGVNAALDTLGLSLLPVGVNGAATASALATAFGGLEAMQASVGAYYDLMYSDAEKAANAAEKLDAQFAALGYSVPENEAAFRALVEGIDVTTTAGQQLAASVLNLAPAFGQAAQSAQAAAANMSSAVSNWGSGDDMRNFRAQQIQKNLADGGLDVSMRTILDSTKESVLDFYKSADPAVQALLFQYQQSIFDFVKTGAASRIGPMILGGNGGGGSGGGGRQILLKGQPQNTSGGLGGGAVLTDAEVAALYGVTDALGGAAAEWQAATAAIMATMDDLQKTLIGNSPNSFAKMKADFAITLAQAKAGDLGAAQDLPAMAKALVNAGNTHNKTALDQARLAASIYNSLGEVVSSAEAAATAAAEAAATAAAEAAGGNDTSLKQSSYGMMYEDKTLEWLRSQNTSGTAADGFAGYHYEGGRWIPDITPGSGETFGTDASGVLRKYDKNGTLVPYASYAVGTNSIPYDQLAFVHAGEEITTRPYVDMQRAARDETNILLNRLLISNNLLQAELAKISENSKQSKFFAGKWDTTGMPPARATL